LPRQTGSRQMGRLTLADHSLSSTRRS
jgi:hypothetical protein